MLEHKHPVLRVSVPLSQVSAVSGDTRGENSGCRSTMAHLGFLMNDNVENSLVVWKIWILIFFLRGLDHVSVPTEAHVGPVD